MLHARLSTEAPAHNRASSITAPAAIGAASAAIERRTAALAVMSELRRIEKASGIENSRIALDIALLLFGVAGRSLSVKEMTSTAGYSGPTIRLVLTRLLAARLVEHGPQRGKTQFYRLGARGEAVMEDYIATLERLARRIPEAA